MSLLSKIKWRIKHYRRRYTERWGIPDYDEKRSIILSYSKKYNTRILIETGTFLGDTLEVLRNDFEKLISFELSEELAERAAVRFAGNKAIKIVQGDSGKLLAKYLSEIQAPCLFWLDGHYSTEFFIGDEYFVTAKGEKNTPILKELEAIFKHPVKGHVVLIDDARCFTGENDYPTIGELRKLVSNCDHKLKLTAKRDIIRIIPKH